MSLLHAPVEDGAKRPLVVKADMRLALLQHRDARFVSALGRQFTSLTERWNAWRARPPQDAKAPADHLRGRFCSKPFEHFELHEDGSVSLCCPAWLKENAGNLNTESAGGIWNSEKTQAVRASILDGSFKYCNATHCPSIQAGTLPTRDAMLKQPKYRRIIEKNITEVEGIPGFINLSNDKSCNLSCPSCRTQRIQLTEGAPFEQRRRLQAKLEESFFRTPTDQSFTVSVTGSGDPFASRIFREFLQKIDGKKFPNMRVNLHTNGLLFTEKMWRSLEKIQRQINAVLVSIDAASEATYTVTRRGGSWKQLLENMQFVSGLRRAMHIHNLRFAFVVQRANFREMRDFIALGQRFEVDEVYFSKAVNWGTWTAEQYRSECVWLKDHPQHSEFRAIIRDPVFAEPIVMLGNLSGERQACLARAW